MKKIPYLFLLLPILFHLSCSSSKNVATIPPAPVVEKVEEENYVKKHYTKTEYDVEMRDGIKLYTAVYVPKDAGENKTYPILLKRTCYSCFPYGIDEFPKMVSPSVHMMEEGYIVVYQDVRGRWRSEGDFDNMRPQIVDKKSNKDIDESSDTYDTIDWLIKNIPNNNGKVGQWGVSYPGFYTTVGALSGHPALKASSPQAPIADFFFDDFHHNGAYLLSYFVATAVFGYQTEGPTSKLWHPYLRLNTPDHYRFFMEMGPLKNGDRFYGEDNFFWQQLKTHPNYDKFWQDRNILPHLKDINHAVMVVGGLFDAEDLYGPFQTYKSIEQKNPGISNTLVMGPWTHGDWKRDKPEQKISWIKFGENLSDFYQKEIEAKFFHFHLKGGEDPELPEALIFDTGKKEWASYDQWPPKAAAKEKLFLHEDGALRFALPAEPGNSFSEYVSDPAKPVPHSEVIKTGFTPRAYMAEDQRFAGRRPDVLVFETEPLTEAITLGGEIMAHLNVSTTGTDADWVVKLIDVYPGDTPDDPGNPEHIRLGNYEQMVRSEVIRGRFRNSFENPEPFVSGKITEVKLPLQGVLHTFKKGHRIMIQIQSTWFPLIDRNPQKYVPNIFEAEEADFIKATHRVYHSQRNPTFLEVDVLK